MRTGKREKDTDKIFGKQMMELRQWTKQQNKGMTLIEVLVVVAILAITVGIAGVSISLATSRDAEKSAKLTQKKIGEKATQAYDLVEQQTAEAQELGINGLTQKILYKGYLIYYKFCDFAISIIIVGWVIAILGNFLFHKLPKIRKFCILFFGVAVTGITFLIVFAPSMIQSLGK